MLEFYRTALAAYFCPRELAFLEILVCQLQTDTTITIEGLAARLPLLVLFESRRKRIQRFLDLAPATVQQIWFSVLAVLLPTKNSHFKLGLYGQLFSGLPVELTELGQALMAMTPSKRLFYWRGERARSKIAQAL